MKAPEFIKSIDWSYLQNQKLTLLYLIDNLDNKNQRDDLCGLVGLIDSIQDYAVDEMGIDVNKIFNLDSTSGSNYIYVCDNCGSDDVEIRYWMGLNNNSIGQSISEDKEDNWCNGCQGHHAILLVNKENMKKTDNFL